MSLKPQHQGIACNECSCRMIMGNRYKCLQCVEYNLCAGCEPYSMHDENHNFVILKKPCYFAATKPILNGSLYKPTPQQQQQQPQKLLPSLQKQEPVSQFGVPFTFGANNNFSFGQNHFQSLPATPFTFTSPSNAFTMPRNEITMDQDPG